ncbi:hypothetical protein AB0J14_04460 [Micromonospora arborensis]|uniref:hypothetical protein n=1 Tax=Micromonospora arborensis TaxID=2116518 RepID=UPI0033F55F95
MTSYEWESAAFDGWTPAQADSAMRWVLRAMYEAQKELRKRRDAEIDAKHTFESAKRSAFFSPDCPKPERGGYTVADREAFIERECAEARRVFELATAAREAAQDALRVLDKQSVVLASLNKNAQQAFNLAGAH